MRKPYQSPGSDENSSYYIAPVGDRTHDLPHTVASNMDKVSHDPLGQVTLFKGAVTSKKIEIQNKGKYIKIYNIKENGIKKTHLKTHMYTVYQ